MTNEQKLAGIFADAIKPFIPEIQAADIEIREHSFEPDENTIENFKDRREMQSQGFLPNERVIRQLGIKTHVKFPADSLGFNLTTALLDAVQDQTKFAGSYSQDYIAPCTNVVTLSTMLDAETLSKNIKHRLEHPVNRR